MPGPITGGGATPTLAAVLAIGANANSLGITNLGSSILTANGAASTPALTLSGTWFTGGSGTTTKPQLLIEPAGTSSTAWSTAGTAIGIDCANSFNGQFLDFKRDGVSKFTLDEGTGLVMNMNLVMANTSTSIVVAGGVRTGDDNAAYRLGASNDVVLARKAAAALQLGFDAAGVTNQMFTAASRITSDGVGANLTIVAGNGRGAAAGSLIFSSWTTEATGVVGTLTTIASIVIGGFVVASGKKLTLGNAAVTGLTAGVLAALTNATIVLTDSGGQDYRIPCII